MNKIYLITLIAVISILISGCTVNQDGPVEIAEKVTSVKAEVLQSEDIQLMTSFTGSLEGEKQAVIYAKIAEAVNKVNVSEGDIVTAGQVIIELDENGPSVNLQQAYVLFKNAEKNYEKLEYLFKEGATSELQYDNAKTQYKVNKAIYESTSKLIYIESPIDGVVTSLNVSSGDFVSKVGQKLATIAKSDKIRVKFDIRAGEIKQLKKGAEVIIYSEDIDQSATGKITALSSSADPMTRVFEGEAVFDNSDSFFKPGMFVRVNFIQETKEDVIVISRKVILTLNNQETVYVVENGTANKRVIELGVEVNGRIIVTGGLSVNDTLVTIGQDYLEQGSKVNITAMTEGK